MSDQPEEEEQQQTQEDSQQPEESPNDDSSSDHSYHSDNSDSDSDSDSDSEEEEDGDPKKPKEAPSYEELYYRRAGEFSDLPKDDNSEAANIERFNRVFQSRRYKQQLEREEERIQYIEDKYDFPYDWEKWREEDLKELWADAPFEMSKPGWDPAWVDKNDWEVMLDELREGRDPPIAPFYLPYRKCYPAIPDNHHDISNPKSVIEELDRIEEFLKWVSFVFQDGSSYEGTVWDDLAHGKGVFVGGRGLTRYEGEWLQNNMEGHGVVEVDIPDIEPIPGSKLESEMRAEGKIIKRDYMSPEDRKWLEMDIEDSLKFGRFQIPFYEKDIWIKQYGKKPEKGRYRYAGQWKHGRMHGCGVYEVNERPIFGRFYFGELMKESAGCTPEICTMHAGIAEVAAGKARMFINKPDGMVREERGPYSDPQHPYFYEEEDMWQAPGFINQFHEVPDYWKTYVQEVDQEREMWLNSFYKAPLRLPMPAELEHWWDNERPPEFVILNKEPEPDPKDPSKLIYTEDPLILHTPTGRIINYIEDEEHGIRLFWQPPASENGNVDPTKVEFLPLGFDEFYGRGTVEKKQGFWMRFVCSLDNALKPWLEKLEKWTEEQKKEAELRRQLLQQELEFAEAELSLEEALEDVEEALKQQEKEAEKKIDMEVEEEDLSAPLAAEQEEKASFKKDVKDEEEEEEEEEEDDDDDGGGGLAPSSFGTVADPKEKKNAPGRSPFSTLSFASSGLLATVPSVIENSFALWKKEKSPLKVPQASCSTRSCIEYTQPVSFYQPFPENLSLRAKIRQTDQKIQVKRGRKLFTASQKSGCQSTYSKNLFKGHRYWDFDWLHALPDKNSDWILSLHIPIECLDSYMK